MGHIMACFYNAVLDSHGYLVQAPKLKAQKQNRMCHEKRH